MSGNSIQPTAEASVAVAAASTRRRLEVRPPGWQREKKSKRISEGERKETGRIPRSYFAIY